MFSGLVKRSNCNDEVALRLTEALRQIPLTQRQIAERLRLSEGHLSAIKNGRRPLTEKVARDFEEQFGVRARWLLEGEEPYRRVGKDLRPVFSDDALMHTAEGVEVFSSRRLPNAKVVTRTAYYCGECNERIPEAVAVCPHCGSILEW